MGDDELLWVFFGVIRNIKIVVITPCECHNNHHAKKESKPFHVFVRCSGPDNQKSPEKGHNRNHNSGEYKKVTP